MKAEINAATEFLSRIFLAHDNIKEEKVAEFKQRLAAVLEERFRDHWHEGCPTKGQAYRCIRICPDVYLDPIIEKVCNDVGVNVEDFNLPFELTLWVDPTEVVCKFGDLKCSYHTVAKKDQTSGNVNNQTDNLDIDDLVENARDLYLKKQTVVVHPLHSTEMHIQQSPYSDGSPNSVTMAVRMNGTVHYNMSGSPPPGFSGTPRGKGKPAHLAHKRGGYHYYGKSSCGKGGFIANGISNGSSTHAASSSHHGYPHHRSHHHQQQQPHHQQPHHHHQHGNGGHHGQNLTVSYSNGYLNGYSDENGYVFEHRPVSPTKINGMSVLPPLSISGGPVQISQSPPTPEQIQQQLQHPPPIPPAVPSHLTQTFNHPPTDISTTLPPPPLPAQHLPPPLTTSSSMASTSNSSRSSTNSSNGAGSGKSAGSGSKFQGIRGHTGSRSKQSSSVKEVK